LHHADDLIGKVVHGLGKRAPAGATIAMPAQINIGVSLRYNSGFEIRVCALGLTAFYWVLFHGDDPVFEEFSI